ncbi:TerD family protein [Sphingobacterium spiritivorum]|uniref:TerD family protein n=1 Tax=Sphingobacterium spiritivorum TaxID=258 RepID=UPI003DA61AA2
MPINLQKGQKIDIGLYKITIGLGWDPNEGTGSEFDLDASAFMIDTTRKIPAEPFFIFYGNTDSPDGALHHTGDDPTGGNSADGDDESIQVNLTAVDSRIQEILLVVTIHEAVQRRQNFGQVRNSYIRIVDDSNGTEVAKYELGEDFSIETAVEFGRLYKRNGQWKFEASGIGYKEDLAYFLSRYYQGQIIK